MQTRRGEIFTIAVSGDYGKPRPALLVQADAFDALPSVTMLRITSELIDAPLIRIPVVPDAQNGLRKPSQIMVDKAVTVPRARLGPRVGQLDAMTLQTVDQSLKAFLSLEGPSPKR